MTSLKNFQREKIYDLSPIETPDIVVVLDHLLLAEADVTPRSPSEAHRF